MSKWMIYLTGTLLVLSLVAPVPAACQSALSQNSGINSSDTWVIADVTMNMQATINTQNAYYNPATKTTSNQIPISGSRTFHIEMGYDPNGGFVANIWPGSTSPSYGTAGVSVIRFANGQVTVFDAAGNPIPLQSPNSNVSEFNPFTLLGSNPGPSVMQSLVVPNLNTFATSENATIVRSYQSSGDVAEFQPAAGTAMQDLSVPATAYDTQNSIQTFYSSNGNWILNAVTRHPKFSSGPTTRTIYWHNLTWHDNSSADSTRAAAGNTATTPPSPGGAPQPASLASPSSSGTIINNLGGSHNVAFVHGLLSNPSTWNRMTGWLNQDFLFGTEVVPSLDSIASISSQCTAFENDINSAKGNDYLFIGHSDGGLVSRCAAQHYQPLNTSVAKGVATVDSPNQGALLAYNTYALVNEVGQYAAANLFFSGACDSPFTSWACFMAGLLDAGAGDLAEYALDVNEPATGDIVPGSPFLTSLNSFGEKFQQAGVVSYTPERWGFMRILNNFGEGCNPEASCGERAAAAKTEAVYDVILIAYFIATDEGDCFLADFLATILDGMDFIDCVWNTLTDPFGNGSDAIVDAPDQYYPYTSAPQFTIDPADSHTGATRSNHVRNALYNALTQTFNVPTQASCSFSVSPPNFSVQSSGGNSSFSLNTQAGCEWSAVSNADWMSITSATSGVSSATISFSINSNPASVPRTGTITAGTSKSSATFTVQEFGVCSYSLANSTVAIPAGGGTATDNVYTQYWCPWSAVPNASWLSITSGASGTGNGSFTVSASSNTGNTSLLGTVTVMSQTLDVVVGDPVGTPGTGSITINGGPRSKQVCNRSCDPSCRRHSCAMTVWESGSVIVTIGGDSYTVSYAGSSWTASNLAATLANQINSTSLLVSASISSNVITLVAKDNGVLTNYSLATSNSFDTNFSSPAATATLSGATMTGGTD